MQKGPFVLYTVGDRNIGSLSLFSCSAEKQGEKMVTIGHLDGGGSPVREDGS